MLSFGLFQLNFSKPFFLNGVMKHLPLKTVCLNSESSPLWGCQDWHASFPEASESLTRGVSKEVLASR